MLALTQLSRGLFRNDAIHVWRLIRFDQNVPPGLEIRLLAS
jgi:hypothetical protein